jgi:hypothetical protein
MTNITYTEPTKNRRGMWEATIKEKAGQGSMAVKSRRAERLTAQPEKVIDYL